MDFDFEAEDNEIDALHAVSYQQLPSAPPSTPNSNISSPPIGNDESTFQTQLFPHNVLDNGDPFLAGMESKLHYSKRGPGRPRKDIPPLKGGLQKRKTIRDGTQQTNSERIGPLAIALSSSENSNTGFSDDKPMPQIVTDELHYAEKHPGKLCCFCNLSERSALGQGDFIRWKTIPDKCELALQYYNEQEKCSSNESLKNTVSEQTAAFRRQKSYSKNNKPTNDNSYNELDKIGHVEILPLRTMLDGVHLYLHRMCLMWSQGVNGKINELKMCIELVVAKALASKCSFCGQYGASVTCKMSCKKMFHLPCAAAASGFLLMENFSLFCNDHVEQVHIICPDNNIACHNCSTIENISKMIMCAACGEHFHTDCVGLIDTPETRTGWNCSNCSKCHICKEADGVEGRFIKCEQCQRLYHTTCLRPIISSLPKYGWKCYRCRVCTDCGSRTPGGGTSSRWHHHYTICDSCYQQRNKGFSCPICHKAYRAAAYKEMVKCSLCHRFVHSTCDEDADLAIYHKKKEANPDYDYVCPQCKSMHLNEKYSNSSGQLRCSMETSDNISHTMEDGLMKEIEIDNFQKENGEFSSMDFQPSKIFKRKIIFKDFQRSRGGKIIVPKGNVLSHLGRKRGSVRGKGRQLLLNNINLATSSDRANSRTSDDGLSNERKILLCSAKDKFILSQDICVMCGSIGFDKESHLIACAQCGQCYHPYCANTKLSKVILDRGWRCLDCTVCERCGQRNDEARLILCDECDLSYHIYCMNPPLDTVPHGNWKCKWCAACQKCGRYSQGINTQSRNNVLECGPCASQVACCVCTQPYTENELIIQCKSCERWLHCRCDSIKSEEEAQICDNIDYHCILCRPKDKSLAQFLALKDNAGNSSKNINGASTSHSKISVASENSSSSTALNEQIDSEVTYWVDGVCMSERGANMIKALSTEIKRKRKMRVPNDSQTKESGIMAAIESVVSGSNENIGKNTDDGGEGGDTSKSKNDHYKDGMVWMGGDSSPPEGFSISTNDEGISILRKKRQRNLQKLGIGGFSVRNRAFKKDSEENALIAISTNVFESEKKKKIIRKKVKSRLSEAYPIYLQEAFFGKILLDTKNQNLSGEDSEASDELMDVSDALFHEEKNAEKPRSPKKIIKESKEAKFNESMVIGLTEEPLNTNITNNLASNIDSNVVNVTQEIEKTQKDNIVGGGDVSKPINIAIQSSFIETKYKDINNDGIAGSVPFISDVPKETLCNITNIAKEKVLSEEHGITVLKPTTEPQPNVQTEFRAMPVLPQTTPEAHLLLKNSPQSHSQGNVSYIVQQPQQAPQNQEQPSQIQILPMQLQMLNSDHVVESPIIEKPIIQQNLGSPFTQMQKPRVATACALSPYLTPTTQQADSVEAIVAGTQKTAEKMRRDEDLGEMATISAVLYANTQHPELKQIYPNWNDRCKQILKRWRSLSNEKKAPFLQQAKDNRSALRMRKSQQDQERICFNQKTLKEQEQERIWKQHQAKAKEAQTNLYSHRSNSFEGNVISDGCTIEKRPVVYSSDGVQRPQQQIFSTRDGEQTNVTSENSDNSTENKHLRTLLLKQQGHDAQWAPTAARSSFFQQPMTYDFKATIQPNPPKVNPFQCDENKTQIKEIPKQVPILNTLEMVQLEQSDGNDNKQSFKQRKDIKSSETGDPELEKLDPDENGAFGDILGGLGDGNDDDLLKSLTAEIGDDFNILEYADPALDELASNQNLLNKLDFEYNDKNSV